MFLASFQSSNVKYIIPFMLVVLYYTNHYSTPGVAIQSHWHILSHNLKSLTNTALTTIPFSLAVTQRSQYIWTHRIFSQVAVTKLSVCTNLPLYQMTFIH